MKIPKKILIITILNFIFIFNFVKASEITFTDIENHWAKQSILQLAEKGVVSGYSDNTFKPEKEITIMEFLKLIIEAGEYTLVRNGNSIYPDFYYETALSLDLLRGIESHDINLPLTRYEMVQVVSNFIGVEDVKESKNIFKDLEADNKVLVLKLANLKIINGYKDKTFRGEGKVTRAEAAKVITNTLSAREKLIDKREYQLFERKDLSNYLGGNSSSIKTFYEIKDNSILVYDNGRYAILDAHSISKEQIDIDKVIKIIRALVSEKAYVGVLYIPSPYTINEFKICYGKNENKALCGEYDFAFTYYENKKYELATKSLNTKFSNACYMRIDLIDMYEGDDIEEFKKDKLKEALKIEFGSSSTRILNYMLGKSKNYENNIGRDVEYSEKKVFGNYIVNYYQKENSIPQFYIERK